MSGSSRLDLIWLEKDFNFVPEEPSWEIILRYAKKSEESLHFDSLFIFRAIMIEVN